MPATETLAHIFREHPEPETRKLLGILRDLAEFYPAELSEVLDSWGPRANLKCGRLSNLTFGPDSPEFDRCHLVPFNGNKVPINGYLYTIPVGGLAISGGVQGIYTNCSIDKVTGQSLVANTIYWVYIYWNGTRLVLDFSRSPHKTSVVDGVEVKNVSGVEDRTCTLVGLLRTNDSIKTWGGGSSQTIASWFNRLSYPLISGLSSVANGVATTDFIKLTGNLEWVTWADDLAPYDIQANIGGTTIGDRVDIIPTIDGTNPHGITGTFTVPSANLPSGTVVVLGLQGAPREADPATNDGWVKVEVFARILGSGTATVQNGLITCSTVAV